MNDQNKDLVDKIFEGFTLGNGQDSETVQRAGVTIWLPEEYKEKFNQLQSRSKRRFGKKIQEMLIKAIDKVSGL